VLTTAGCQVFAPSPFDFTLGSEALGELVRSTGIPTLAPFETTDPRLAPLVPRVFLQPLPDVPVVIESRFGSSLLDELRADGLEARGHGRPWTAPDGTFHILVVHSDDLTSNLGGQQPTWRLVERPGTVDLLIDPDLGHDLTLQKERAQGPVVLVGRDFKPARTWTLSEIRLELVRRGDSLEIHRIETMEHDLTQAHEPEDSALAVEVRQAFRTFRRASERPLPPGAPENRAELEVFVLKAMREKAEAEIAILNRGALRPVDSSYFEEAPLRFEAVRRLLSIDQHLVIGELTGAQLRQLAERSLTRVHPDGTPRQSALFFQGLTFDTEEGDAGTVAACKDSFQVNGRQLYEDDLYRVVTNRFLADGGDGYPLLQKMERRDLLRPRDGEPPLEVREDIIIPRLEDPKPFLDLKSRGLWRFGIDRASFSYAGVDTSADPAYAGVADSRVRAPSSSTLAAALKLRADQEWSHFRWENRLEARLDLVDTASGVESELVDNLGLEVGGLFTKSRFLGARPYTSLYYDTELRRNRGPGGLRLPRQRETTLALGLRFDRPRFEELRLAVIAQHRDDTESAERFGLRGEMVYELPQETRRPGFKTRLFAEQVEGDGATIRRIDFELRLLFALTEHLKITPIYNYYFYEDSRLPGSAHYQRFSIGLDYTWAKKLQRR
jgi:hypothetical protein